jgi:four helix bundle protein
MKINNFTDLEAWQVNHKAALLVYKLTEKFPSNERFGIVDQIRRAASSVTANIAEGWGRFHYLDKMKFYYQARGSNTEVQNFLILSRDLGFLKENDYNSVTEIVSRGIQVLNGLIRFTEKRKQEET